MNRFPENLKLGDREVHLSAIRLDGHRFRVRVGEATFEIEARDLGEGAFAFRDPAGRRHHATAAVVEGRVQIRLDGRTWILDSPERKQESGPGEDAPGRILAPMTGTIVKVRVEEGTEVEEGEELCVLTAMKMEHRLCATFAGRVAEVRAREGETVEAGTLLVLLEAPQGD